MSSRSQVKSNLFITALTTLYIKKRVELKKRNSKICYWEREENTTTYLIKGEESKVYIMYLLDFTYIQETPQCF